MLLFLENGTSAHRQRPMSFTWFIDRWERINGVVQSTQQIGISKIDGQMELTNDSLTIPFNMFWG
ncbi:hypothetical protein N7465_008598 [Penicillium sp. CMV-2018d]|nr:hypothetical protein N7465_008598 [Penicillium sp. CMV-2018d]